MRHLLIAASATALLASPALAKDDDKDDRAPPQLYQQVLDCKAVSDPAARLACYDEKVAALAAATASKDIVVADKAQVREARRGLFGFAAPIGRLLGLGGGSEDDDDEEGISRLETTVARVGRTRDGALKLEFAEGGTWEQTDRYGFPLTPKVGHKAVLTKGAVGSYFVSVDGMAGIKMRRVE